jgi:hypothetical protein
MLYPVQLCERTSEKDSCFQGLRAFLSGSLGSAVAVFVFLFFIIVPTRPPALEIPQ